jgi:hypothetical protein
MKRATLLTLLILALLLGAAPVHAQDGYDLDWWTVDDGGANNQAGANGYSLGGTIGQPDAATWQAGGTGGSQTHPYQLSGGFWFTGLAVTGYEIFLPVIVQGGP